MGAGNSRFSSAFTWSSGHNGLDNEAIVLYPQEKFSSDFWSPLSMNIRTQLWWRNGSVRGFTNR